MISSLLIWFKGLWSNKVTYIVLGILALFLITFIKGCNYGKKLVKCPIIVTGITIIHDTILHHIPDYKPWYIQGKDSIVYVPVPINIDTTAILADYFAIHIYPDRHWSDTLVDIHLADTITQNKPIGNSFTYKLLKPQLIESNSIDNSIVYNRYVYLGAAMPLFPFRSNTISNINYLSIEAMYASDKGYIRVNWQPYVKIYSLGVGGRLFQFKK